MAIEAFAHPSTVKEAVNLLATSEQQTVILGGGTTLARGRWNKPTLVVDVTRCGIDKIEVRGDRIHVGATARCADIARADLPGASGRLLTQVARGVATQPLRNAITLGGNLVQLVSWADFPVALLALDATVHVADLGSGEFDMPIADLVAEHPQKVLPKGALVVGVSVATGGGSRGAAFRRFRTSATDYSLVTVAAVVTAEDKKCTEVAISLGAVGPRPVRAAAAEKYLLSKRLTPRPLASAGQLAADKATISPNYRMAPELRRRILSVEVRRALADAAEDANKA